MAVIKHYIFLLFLQRLSLKLIDNFTRGIAHKELPNFKCCQCDKTFERNYKKIVSSKKNEFEKFLQKNLKVAAASINLEIQNQKYQVFFVR